MTVAALPAPPCRLAHYLESFYAWLYRLSRRDGFCWKSNQYLAEKQGRHPDTIRERIALLETAGWLRREQVDGVERRLVPLVAPPAKDDARPPSLWQQTRARLIGTCSDMAETMDDEPALPAPPLAVAEQADSAPSSTHPSVAKQAIATPISENQPEHHQGKLTGGDTGGNPQGDPGGTRGVNPLATLFSISKAFSNNTNVANAGAKRETPAENDSAVVVALWEAGIRPLALCRSLLENHSESVCLAQLEALPYRKIDRNAAGELRRSIEQDWAMPDTLLKKQESEQAAARAAAQRAREEAIKAENARKIERTSEKARKVDISAFRDVKEQQAAHVPPELKEPWQRVLTLLQGDARINKPTFEAHFRAISPVSHTPCGQVAAAPDAITLAVPSAFSRNWLEDRHLAPLCEALTAVLGREVSVRLVVFGDWLKTAQGAAT